MTLRFVFNLLKPQTARSVLIRRAHDKKSLIVFDTFSLIKEKNKKNYIDMLKLFEKNDPRRRNHCEFIASALKYMEEFNVHKDLDVYKALLEVLPKGRFVAQNVFQAEFMHYPKQQQVALQLLEQMEDNGVMPDTEMEDILINTFGRRGFPVRKYWRMMYWMPKFKNLSPWPLPDALPNDTLELAKLAIKRITSVDLQMEVSVFKTEDVEDSLDRTWIVSAQCPIQKKLLQKEAQIRREELKEQLEREMEEDKNGNEENTTSENIQSSSPVQKDEIKHKPPREPLKVHGAYRVYLKDQVVQYFVLTGPAVIDRKPEYKDSDDILHLDISTSVGSSSVPALQSDVHEQDDGTILAVCATGTSTRDSLLSWIRLLEKNDNPGLSDIPVVFTLTAPYSDLVVKVTDPATGE